jgi:hypothetical protein
MEGLTWYGLGREQRFLMSKERVAPELTCIVLDVGSPQDFKSGASRLPRVTKALSDQCKVAARVIRRGMLNKRGADR